ncbi:type II toxin-antitoxin system HicB family antitoxin [Paracoccus sp. (in: a-proteobacteria)]|uniref:type II toxin-antitoxin system HicB family antitoxin n=1 Tax=Paracoccus sp. TaxID=267 RepID=UPI003A86E67C
MRYVAFLHTDEADGFGISFPDFPGAISDGETVDQAIQRGEEALAFHVQGMHEDGLGIPVPRTVDAILADPELAEWRAGAQIAHVALILDRGSPKRVNVSLDPGLLEAIDAEAARRGMTRSAFLSSAARAEIKAAH